MCKRIVKINKHTAEPICSLTNDEFMAEMRAVHGLDLKGESDFGNSETEVFETENYTYIYVQPKKNLIND